MRKSEERADGRLAERVMERIFERRAGANSGMKRLMYLASSLLFTTICMTGCQLAKPDAGETIDDPAKRDRLVGVLVSDEYVDLYDTDAWLEDNLDEMLKGGTVTADPNDANKYRRRLYASKVERPLYDENGKQTSSAVDFVFEGINAVMCYCATVYKENGEIYHTSYADPGMVLTKNHIRTTDEGTFVEMEGTVYVAADGNDVIYQILPIYQTAEGELFLVQGDSISLNTSVEGMSMTYTYSETTETGDTSGEKTADGSTMKVSVEVVNRPFKVAVSQLDTESRLLSRVEYPAGKVPEKLVPETDTAYIIVETFKEGTEGETVERQMVGREDVNFRTMIAGENEICEQVYTSIQWAGEK